MSTPMVAASSPVAAAAPSTMAIEPGHPLPFDLPLAVAITLARSWQGSVRREGQGRVRRAGPREDEEGKPKVREEGRPSEGEEGRPREAECGRTCLPEGALPLPIRSNQKQSEAISPAGRRAAAPTASCRPTASRASRGRGAYGQSRRAARAEVS